MDEKRLTQDLMLAAKTGKGGDLVAALDSGADVNAVDRVGRTALLYAAYRGYSGAVQVLVERGANLEVTDDDRTPLMWAIYEGHRKIVRILLEKGAKPYFEKLAYKITVSRNFDHAGDGEPAIKDLLCKYAGWREDAACPEETKIAIMKEVDEMIMFDGIGFLFFHGYESKLLVAMDKMRQVGWTKKARILEEVVAKQKASGKEAQEFGFNESKWLNQMDSSYFDAKDEN